MLADRLRPWSTSPIMVIDDQESNLLLLSRLLEAAGAERVECFTQPQVALAELDAMQPHLVILDLHMPHMDGFAVMDAMLARLAPDELMPIIVITADATAAARERALGAGAKDFITKPFDATEVVLRVANLLQSRALHSGLREHNAALAAELKARDESFERRARMAERREQITSALAPDALRTVFQPMVDLSAGQVVGVEALSRFRSKLLPTPDLWFDEAHRVGLGRPLELAAVRSALSQIERLPQHLFVSVNLSPDAVMDPSLPDHLPPSVLGRLVIEITEHARTSSTRALVEVLEGLRASGARIAVDDTGAGFAGLKQILELAPQIIKLDVALTRGIDRDPVRRSMTRCLLAFANEIGALIVAEGVETAEELMTLRELGVTLGQGYYLAQPMPADEVAAVASRMLLD
jgi:EAL domain-containing protein (putative c-di-GMP-specific phosphodiesterase class I)/DNA-binding NarL/FixJ family response regulator